MRREAPGMRNLISLALPIVLALGVSASVHADDEKFNRQEIAATVALFKKQKDTAPFFKSAYGYVVFPTVTRGSIGIGGAYGTGGVYKKGSLVAKSTLAAVSIGIGLGGEAYSEIVFIKDKATWEKLEYGKLELGARATAKAGGSGASTEASYSDGLAVFTANKGGLIADASVGGQKISFEKL